MGYAPCERPRSARDTRPRRWPSSPDAGRILKLDDGPIPLRSMTPDEVWEALVNVVEQETGVKRAEIGLVPFHFLRPRGCKDEE